MRSIRVINRIRGATAWPRLKSGGQIWKSSSAMAAEVSTGRTLGSMVCQRPTAQSNVDANGNFNGSRSNIYIELSRAPSGGLGSHVVVSRSPAKHVHFPNHRHGATLDNEPAGRTNRNLGLFDCYRMLRLCPFGLSLECLPDSQSEPWEGSLSVPLQ